MNHRLEIEKTLTAFVGKELICPDGETRRLKTFECGRNEVTALHWGAGKFVEYRNADFFKEWARYEPAVKPDEPVSETQLAEVFMTPQVKQTELVSKSVLDTTDMVSMMQDQMKKVSEGGELAIQRANAMANLAKQIVEAGKLKVLIMKTVNEINQPVKS